MDITLPPRISSSGKPTETLKIGAGERRIVVIGANGAGKTRFTARIVADLKARSLCLSALAGIYKPCPPEREPAPSSLESRLALEVCADQFRRGNSTELDLLLAQLLHDEMSNLMAYKMVRADHPEAELRPTRLDRVVELWREVFPSNRVLLESGKILFGRGLDNDTYPAIRLSDGERAVLYYSGAILYAPSKAVVFVDSPEMFLHPTVAISLWNRLEMMRPDCTFCYTTHDTEFASSRTGAPVIWVRDFSPSAKAWDYEILPMQTGIPQELYMALVGSRKPILFIEGDGRRSIDGRLYPLIFPDFTVTSLGSCNKVIEATRTFRDLSALHKMDSFGIVDRDRRDDHEVAYLRGKNVMVPDVAEIENMLMLEDVVRAMARAAGKDDSRVFVKVRKAIVAQFKADLHQQALLHTRHRVKRTLEYRADARFGSIGELEAHLTELIAELDARKLYENICRRFNDLVNSSDYNGILKVYNQKSMLATSNVAPLCGFKNRDEYIDGIIRLLRSRQAEAANIRIAVRRCLGLPEQ